MLCHIGHQGHPRTPARGKKRTRISFFSRAFYPNVQPAIQNVKKGKFLMLRPFHIFGTGLRWVKLIFSNFPSSKIEPGERRDFMCRIGGWMGG